MIAHDLTAKDQVWTVEVTPVTADDRRGVAAIAEVTILNTSPTIRTVGLSTYRPIAGDTLTALRGDTADVDGDTVSIRYRWLVDGDAVGGTSSQLDLADVPADAEIFVEARAFDGTDESNPVDAGPALVVSATTRWIQHLPDRGNIQFVTYDERHQRVLLATKDNDENGAQLWEHDLDADRFVRLRPGGTAPRAWSFPYAGNFDPTDDRIYFITGEWGGPIALVALDVRDRGREAWTELPLTGEIPPNPPTTGSVLDAAGNRIFFLSQDSDGAFAELWQIELGVSSGIVSRLAGGLSFELLGGTWVSVGDGAFLLGGGPSIHRLPFDTPALEELGATLPVSGNLMAAAA